MDLAEKKAELEKVLVSLKAELSKLRTGRANPAMIDGIRVDYYGTMMSLNQMSAVSVPEPRQLLITPWDKNALLAIEKAIRDANLGLNPANEGDKIRITIPELTEERRLELVKVAARIVEEARVKVRSIREEIWKDIQNQEGSGKITEDDKFTLKNELQKLVDEYNEKIKGMAEGKEKEIMTI